MTSIFVNASPVKSVCDQRSYRSVTLPNGLQALLIHDPKADKAAAALDVRVGQLCDPSEALGLAHFLEHMLFLGTEKYPEENSYSSFLSAHGGRSNAFTSLESTNYHFEVAVEHLEETLDRFAQFFIAPLFTESATEREMQAVDSEHSKNLQDDHWRLFQLLRSTSRDSHPFQQFGTGNLKTLRDIPAQRGLQVRDSMLSFYKKYYSAEVMRLAVLGRDDLDVLQNWVVSRFSAIGSRGLHPPSFSSEVFGERQLGHLYRIVPVKDLRQVEMCFPLPAQQPLYRSKPTRYLTHLLGHEGPGSVLAYLKGKGWANELSAGISHDSSFCSVFSVTAQLTMDGLRHVEDVVCTVFQYINLLRREGPKDWVWEEVQSMASLDFRFENRESPCSVVTHLAGAMHLYPTQDLLTGPRLLFNYEPTLISQVLELLTPDNLMVHVLSQEFETEVNQHEPWYQTAYAVLPVADSVRALWDTPTVEAPLHLPIPNPYIPTDVELKPLPQDAPKYPRCVVDSSQVKLWFKQDDTFEQPRAVLYCQLVSALCQESVASLIAANVWIKLVEDGLNETSYFAQVAGLGYTLVAGEAGVLLYVSGYQHKLTNLSLDVLASLCSLPLDTSQAERRFELIKEQLLREYRNFFMEQPYQHAMFNCILALTSHKYSMEERIQALEDLTLPQVMAFRSRFLKRVNVESLLLGNFVCEEAQAMADSLSAQLKCEPLLPSQFPETRVVNLLEGVHHQLDIRGYNDANLNSAIQSYWQIGPYTPGTSLDAATDLFTHILREPCFDQLRTKEQLGYIVFSGAMRHSGVLGMRVIVQSSNSQPDHLQDRVTQFLRSFRATLVDLTEERFNQFVSGLISNKLEKDKKLTQEAMRHWNEIEQHRYMFHKVDLEVAALRVLSKEDVLRFYDTHVMDANCLKRLTIAIWTGEFSANSQSDSQLTRFTDIRMFRRSASLYPCFV